MKDALLVIGVIVGAAITGIGAKIIIDSRGDYAGERMFNDFAAAPFLVVGVPILALCVWGLMR